MNNTVYILIIGDGIIRGVYTDYSMAEISRQNAKLANELAGGSGRAYLEKVEVDKPFPKPR